MKIICSGFQKTGTKSLAAALRLLGYNVYDFEEQFYYLGKDLNRIFKEGWTNEDIRRIYKDVDAVIDVPSCIIWEELHKAFPEAKIIHTERSNELDWIKSLEKQHRSMQTEYLNRFIIMITQTGGMFSELMNVILRLQCGTPCMSPWRMLDLNKQFALSRYRQHNDHVRMSAPKGQTLIYSVTEGWLPLCKFLGKDIPNHEFPHENKGAAITKKVIQNSLLFKKIRKEFLIILGFLISSVFGVRFLLKLLLNKAKYPLF